MWFQSHNYMSTPYSYKFEEPLNSFAFSIQKSICMRYTFYSQQKEMCFHSTSSLSFLIRKQEIKLFKSDQHTHTQKLSRIITNA